MCAGGMVIDKSDYTNYRQASIWACWTGDHRKTRKSSARADQM